jgi:hypothetical protein
LAVDFFEGKMQNNFWNISIPGKGYRAAGVFKVIYD